MSEPKLPRPSQAHLRLEKWLKDKNITLTDLNALPSVLGLSGNTIFAILRLHSTPRLETALLISYLTEGEVGFLDWFLEEEIATKKMAMDQARKFLQVRSKNKSTSSYANCRKARKRKTKPDNE